VHVHACTYMHVHVCMHVCMYVHTSTRSCCARPSLLACRGTDGPSCIHTLRDARIFLRNFRPEIFLPNFRPRERPLPSATPPPPRPPRRAQPRRDAELTSYLRKFLRANSCAELARIKSALLPSPLRPRRRDSEISGLRHVVDLDDTSKAREFQRRGRERHWLQYGTVITHCLSS